MTPETPALSPSIAHVLTSESPLHAWTIHRLLGNRPRPVTDAQERGRLIHSLLLEDGAGVEVIEADSFRTKEAKAARDAAREAGKIPVVREKYEAALTVAGRLGERIAKLGISLDGGMTEQRIEWREMGAADDVLCHGRLDWWSANRTRIVDIKTTDGSVHPDACAASLVRDAGVIQEAAYVRAVEQLHPELAGRVSTLFLFCELSEPWAVTPIELGGSMREIGAMRWARAVDLWAHCLKHDSWPTYATGPIRVEAPAWALAREMDKEAA
jgi:hypothetical protein